MRAPKTVRSAERLGRVRLSPSFFMRDFLYSEIANMHGITNLPDDPDLAVAAGTRLCEEVLEPLQATFGRIAIRSAYRSPALNAYGNLHHYTVLRMPAIMPGISGIAVMRGAWERWRVSLCPG